MRNVRLWTDLPVPLSACWSSGLPSPDGSSENDASLNCHRVSIGPVAFFVCEMKTRNRKALVADSAGTKKFGDNETKTGCVTHGQLMAVLVTTQNAEPIKNTNAKRCKRKPNQTAQH